MQDGDLPVEGTQDDAWLRHMIEQENAMLNPDEWGIYLMPIFKQRLHPPVDPDKLNDAEIRYFLTHSVHLLAEHHFCLTNTNHLDDRQLYQHILDEILPKPVGVGPNPIGGILYHECCPCDDFDRWLAYYAADDERDHWKEEWDEPLPEKKSLVSDRDIWLNILAESFRDEPLPVYEDVP
jgi:hypothetical protein